MKTSFLIAVLVTGLMALVARAAEPAIECTGVLVAGVETRVALARKGTAPAQRVLVGGEFGGFIVTACEANNGVVVLTREGRQYRITMKEAKVVPGAAEPAPEIKKTILANLRQLAALADQYYLENGRMTVTFDDLVGPNSKIKGPKTMEPIDGEDYRSIKFEQGKPLSVRTSGGFTVSVQP